MPISFAAIGLVFLVLANAVPREAAICAMPAGALLLVQAAWVTGEPHFLRALATAPQQRLRPSWTLIARPDHEAAAARAALAKLPGLPWHPSGSADIYSTGQLRLFASGLPWSPRPVLQSYSAYTPALAAQNAAHLRSPAAPDNVFFQTDIVDEHLPALEDGPSWKLLLSLYDIAGYDGATDTLWLRRSAAPPLPVVPAALPPITAATGARVALPETPQALWARVDIQPTPAGRLAALLWRAPLLHIRLDFPDAPPRNFRFVPGMGRSGFLLSPFVGGTIDFLRLRTPPGAMPDLPPRPLAIAVFPDKGGAWAWQDNYRITLQAASLPPLKQAAVIQNVALPYPIASLPGGAPAVCYLDSVDGAPPPAGVLAATMPVKLEGWAVFDRAARLPADRIEIGLQNASGASFAVPAFAVPRDDVSAVLHLAGAPSAGFATVADFAALPVGQYDFFAIVRRGQEARQCKLPLALKRDGS